MKILIVDDSRFHQNFVVKILNKYLPEGELLLANNGMEGFEMFEKERPAFVLTDLLMPERNGQDLLRLIKACDSNASVIVVSADIQKSTREEVKQLGALAFFNKPLTNETASELIALIKETSHA
ncbi:MAG: response regulator [Firmicutes bacterium HGW-Firmicutes-15]|nr:MAG: response regulator [Firmicutes bacterium HGW-Firmicutes-15]